MYAIINLSANIFCALTVVLLMAGTLIGSSLQEKTTRWFFLMLLLVLLGVLNEVIMNALDGVPGESVYRVLRVTDYFSYVVWGLQVIALNVYVYEYVQRKVKLSSRPFYLATFFGVMTIVFATIAQFNDMYGYFDSLNRYHQQPTFWVATIFPLLAVSAYVFVVLKHRKTLQVREWGSLLFYAFMFLFFYVVTYFNPQLWIAYVGAVIALFIIYLNVQLDLKRELIEQKVQLEETERVMEESQKTLLAMKSSQEQAQSALAQRVRIQCFDNFAIFVDGKPFHISRPKVKELLAYLVHKQGASATSAEIASILWEDKKYNKSLQSQTRNTVSQLMTLFKEAGINAIVHKEWNSIAIDTRNVTCDYYAFLAGEEAAKNAYRGKYLDEYSWAEYTTGHLNERLNK